jgi:hypothetical protein
MIGVALSASRLALAASDPAPRLAVVISVDQFRYDYLVRFRPYFGAGGFKKLLEGGADYQECRYRHAITKTAPGHATILSGVNANVHGIVGNEWLDRASWLVMNAVEDPDSPIVGGPAGVPHSPGGLLERKSGRSPLNFRATTVGDQLKLRFGAASRVVAVSNKDRAAILLGGKLADAAYWQENDRMVSSRFYEPVLPDWVSAFNGLDLIKHYFGSSWTRLLPAAAYETVQGPDDVPGETLKFGYTHNFPHRIDGGHPDLRSSYYDAFEVGPYSSEVLGQFAIAALHAEKLGQHPHTDLLCISFSQIDHVGHEFGPDSQEMMDSVLRLDGILARVIAAVEAQVGTGRYLLVLTGDHGSAPLPEKINAMNRGIPAARYNGAAMDKAVAEALTAAFGALPGNEFWCTRDNFGYTFHPSALAARGVTLAQASAVLKRVIAAFPEISTVYTTEELGGPEPMTDSILDMSRRSFFPGRSVDVAFVFRPYMMDRDRFGINHGTPWDYDTHVPLLWFGAGVTPGVHPEAVNVEDLAPTLAAQLEVPRPPQARGRRLF